MPQIAHLIWADAAREDIIRLRAFISKHHPEAARRAAETILKSTSVLLKFPAIGRPVEDMEGFRDLYIPFGQHGYVLRYLLEHHEVVVLRVWHGRETRE
ncbi:MAG: type II toxin-antitoxin system RelE/ParE family toxin [Bdellovibrionales bacterium]